MDERAAGVSTEARRGATHRFTSGPSLLARLISRCRFWKCSTRGSMVVGVGWGMRVVVAGCKSVEAQSGQRVDTGARGEKFARQAQRNARQRSGALAVSGLAAHVMACQRAVDQSQSALRPLLRPTCCTSCTSWMRREITGFDARILHGCAVFSCLVSRDGSGKQSPENRRDGPRSCICSWSQMGHAWRPSIRQRHQDVIRVDT